MRDVDVDRLLAFDRLLLRRDEHALRDHRRHRMTQPGARDRMLRTWLPAARAWIERRLAESMGAVEGWKPAASLHVTPIRRGVFR